MKNLLPLVMLLVANLAFAYQTKVECFDLENNYIYSIEIVNGGKITVMDRDTKEIIEEVSGLTIESVTTNTFPSRVITEIVDEEINDRKVFSIDQNPGFPITAISNMTGLDHNKVLNKCIVELYRQ